MLFMAPGSCKRNRPVIKCIIVSGKSARQLLTGAFALSKQVFEIYQRGVQDALVQAVVAAGQAVAELLVEPLSGEVLDVGVEAHHAPSAKPVAKPTISVPRPRPDMLGGTQSVCMTMTSSSEAS